VDSGTPHAGSESELVLHEMFLTHRHSIGILFFNNIGVNAGLGGHEFVPLPASDQLKDVGILSLRVNVNHFIVPCSLIQLSEPLKMSAGRELGSVIVSWWWDGSVNGTGSGR
jgi:hypothetical protein